MIVHHVRARLTERSGRTRTAAEDSRPSSIICDRSWIEELTTAMRPIARMKSRAATAVVSDQLADRLPYLDTMSRHVLLLVVDINGLALNDSPAFVSLTGHSSFRPARHPW